MLFVDFLLGAQHNRDSVENNPASLLVGSLGKALNDMPPCSCGRQMVGPSSLPIVVAQSNEGSQTEHERTRNVYISSSIMLRTNWSNDEEDEQRPRGAKPK